MAPTSKATAKSPDGTTPLKISKAVKSGTSLLKKMTEKNCNLCNLALCEVIEESRNPKYPRISAPPRNKRGHYQILKFPLTRESAMNEIEGSSTLVSIIDIRADEKKIKAATKKMYEIQAMNV